MPIEPAATDLRFSARVDYFRTEDEAVAYAKTKIHEGYNVNGGSGPEAMLVPSGVYRGLWSVHWVDRRGEGWYG